MNRGRLGTFKSAAAEFAKVAWRDEEGRPLARLSDDAEYGKSFAHLKNLERQLLTTEREIEAHLGRQDESRKSRLERQADALLAGRSMEEINAEDGEYAKLCERRSALTLAISMQKATCASQQCAASKRVVEKHKLRERYVDALKQVKSALEELGEACAIEEDLRDALREGDLLTHVPVCNWANGPGLTSDQFSRITAWLKRADEIGYDLET